MAYGNKIHKVMRNEVQRIPQNTYKKHRSKNSNNQQEIDDFELNFEFNAAHFIAFALAIYTAQFATIPAILTAIFIVLSACKIKMGK